STSRTSQAVWPDATARGDCWSRTIRITTATVSLSSASENSSLAASNGPSQPFGLRQGVLLMCTARMGGKSADDFSKNWAVPPGSASIPDTAHGSGKRGQEGLY